MLSRRLANSNHFPAIDIGASISRLMADIVSDEHKRLAARVRDVMGIYEKNADLVSVGAYKAGTNPRLDYALGKMDGINQFLALKELPTLSPCHFSLEELPPDNA